jgi:hypothetical protein
VDPNIEPPGLDIGCTCREPAADGGGGLWVAGERWVDGLGALELHMREGDLFSRRI